MHTKTLDDDDMSKMQINANGVWLWPPSQHQDTREENERGREINKLKEKKHKPFRNTQKSEMIRMKMHDRE